MSQRLTIKELRSIIRETIDFEDNAWTNIPQDVDIVALLKSAENNIEEIALSLNAVNDDLPSMDTQERRAYKVTKKIERMCQVIEKTLNDVVGIGSI